MERKTGFEPATPTLARLYSTTELLPHIDNTLLIEVNIEKYFYYRDLKDDYFRYREKIMVRVKGVEPPRLAALDPKSSASANSATPA